MMCLSNIVLWCFAFLLVSSSSKSQDNSTNGNEENDNSTVQYDSFISFVENHNVEPTLCNSCENFVNNTNKMEDKSSVNSTKDNREQNDQMSMESYANSTEISYSILQKTYENLTETEGKSNSMSNQLHRNSSIDDNNKTTIVSYEACKKIICIQLCCPFGNGLTMRGKCVPAEENYNFPSIFTYGNNSQGKKLNEMFPLTFHDPCAEREVGYWYNPPDTYLLFANGSLHLQSFSNLILPKSYCLAFLVDFQNRYDVITCTEQTKLPIYVSACFLVSLPFLLLTFVVYSILSDLQIIHGYTLRAYVASLFVTYAIIYFFKQNESELMEWKFCVPLAYLFNFTFLSSFFWLNVTCFDIWWTFSGLNSHQTGKSRDKKKFIMYSLYAWGVTFIINVICAIMDAPGIPETYIRPEMCRKRFWLSDSARTVYFYVPMTFIIIANICFFIITSITLLRQNKYKTRQLRASESKRQNENKQRFKMYIKLFIVMGITWVMELLSWFIGLNIALEIWYPTVMLNALQGVIIFIIFVCQKNIKTMFLKQYGGRSCLCCKIPTYDDIVTNTTSTSASTTQVSMQEIRSPN